MSFTDRINPPRASLTLGGIRWSMLISHHPPCDCDRTFKTGSVRICARCSGVLLGVIASVLLQVNSDISASIIPIWVSFLLPLPAIVDFTTHELDLWRSNNAKRLASGVLLGFAVGVSGYAILDGYIFVGVLVIAWLAILEFAVAVTLRYAGRLDGYVERYEKGVRKSFDEFVESQCRK